MTCVAELTDTADWLRRSLLLSSSGSSQEIADGWLKAKSEEGDVKPKEGLEGKWVIFRPR